MLEPLSESQLISVGAVPSLLPVRIKPPVECNGHPGTAIVKTGAASAKSSFFLHAGIGRGGGQGKIRQVSSSAGDPAAVIERELRLARRRAVCR